MSVSPADNCLERKGCFLDWAAQILVASPIGQTFTAPSATIGTFGFFVQDINQHIAPTDFSVTVSLYDGVGTGGTLLATKTFTDLTDGYFDYIDVDFSSVVLVPGNTYTAIISNDTVRWAVVSFCGFDDSIDTYPDGEFLIKGSPTGCSPYQDARFRIAN
jgi:hypothetical protein